MKDIGAVLASLFIIFILISLLSVDDTQNFGLNSSLGKPQIPRLAWWKQYYSTGKTNEKS